MRSCFITNQFTPRRLDNINLTASQIMTEIGNNINFFIEPAFEIPYLCFTFTPVLVVMWVIILVTLWMLSDNLLLIMVFSFLFHISNKNVSMDPLYYSGSTEAATGPDMQSVCRMIMVQILLHHHNLIISSEGYKIGN